MPKLTFTQSKNKLENLWNGVVQKQRIEIIEQNSTNVNINFNINNINRNLYIFKKIYKFEFDFEPFDILRDEQLGREDDDSSIRAKKWLLTFNAFPVSLIPYIRIQPIYKTERASIMSSNHLRYNRTAKIFSVEDIGLGEELQKVTLDACVYIKIQRREFYPDVFDPDGITVQPPEEETTFPDDAEIKLLVYFNTPNDFI